MLSILIPAYNGETFLRAAVLSATRQVQSMAVEVIVCDDGSSDGTAEVLAQLQSELGNLRVVRHAENRGVSAARNSLMAALGPETAFVAFFDADDVYAEGALEAALAEFVARPETDYTRGRCQVVPSSVLERGETIGAEWPILHTVTLSASVIRAAFLAQIGPFNTELAFGEDLDFLLRMAETSPKHVVHDTVMFYYRRHGSNATMDVQQMRRGAMQAMMLHGRRKARNPQLYDVSGVMPKGDPEVILKAMKIRDDV